MPRKITKQNAHKTKQEGEDPTTVSLGICAGKNESSAKKRNYKIKS